MHQLPKFLYAGDRALVVEFGDAIREDIHARVRGLYLSLKRDPLSAIEEVIPSYRSVLIQYDPLRCELSTLYQDLHERLSQLQTIEPPRPRTIVIPVIYGGQYGEDLEQVAIYHGMTQQQVIDIHTAGDYLVYMLGFTPGFPYLGGMPEQIATPRLLAPRTSIPAGSVGIAGSQTGIYPLASPGGWQLIGRTPLSLYQPQQNPPTLLLPGDRIRFQAIEEAEFKRISAEVAASCQ